MITQSRSPTPLQRTSSLDRSLGRTRCHLSNFARVSTGWNMTLHHCRSINHFVDVHGVDDLKVLFAIAPQHDREFSRPRLFLFDTNFSHRHDHGLFHHFAKSVLVELRSQQYDGGRWFCCPQTAAPSSALCPAAFATARHGCLVSLRTCF